MRDKSKQLLVINTGKKKSEQTGMPSQSGTTHIIGGGGLSVNMSDYLLKSIWDKVFEIRTDSQGTEYIFGKLPMVTQYGITMYSGDGVVVPSLASGLPFDGITIWYNPDTQQIEVIGGTGGGSGEGVSNFWDLSGIPSWITNSKPKYTYSEIEGTPDLSGYATESWVLGKSYITSATLGTELGKYVTLDTDQSLKGKKDFKNGLSIDGLEIRKSQDDVVYIDANLVVRGGVTMYAQNEVDIPSIIDAIPTASTTVKGIASFDGNYFSVDANGKVSLIASNVGLNEEELYNYLTSNNYAKKTDIPSLVGYATQSWVNTRIDSLINGAPAAYDTLKEIADVLQGNVNSIGDIITALGTKWTQDNTKIANWDTAYSWGNHANVGYALKSYVDSTFVTLGITQTITGEKNFTGGLKVNGSPIYYDTEKKYWKLEGDLLVTGGVTMYGSDSSFTPSTIMDAIAVDGTTISKDGGVLKVIGGTGGGVADSVAWAKITGKPTFATVATSGKYSDLSGTPSSLPASDVYSWAKSATKPTYTWSEITSKPTWIGSSKPSYSYSEITGAISTTELQNYLTQNSYLNVTSGDNRYLKLSGGTIDSFFGGFEIKRDNPYASAVKYSNANGTLGYIGINDDYSPMLWNKDMSESGVVLHSGNYSQYALPLTGGRIDGASYLPLHINSTNTSVVRSSLYITHNGGSKAQIGWDGHSGWGTFLFNYSSNGVLGITDSGTPYFGIQGGTLNTLIHSGNIGEYTIRYYGNQGAIDFDNVLYNGVQYTSGSSVNGGKHYGALMSLWAGDTAWQIVGGRANGELMYRSGNGTSTSWSAWKTIAFTDSNVASATQVMVNYSYNQDINYPLVFTSRDNIGAAKNGAMYVDYYGRPTYNTKTDTLTVGNLSGNASSATKLQTSRTIWGQSFDGTGNVSGRLDMDSLVYFMQGGTAHGYLGFASSDTDLYLSANRTLFIGGKNNLILNGHSDQGNVGIGTTSPSQKLHVQGAGYFNEFVIVNGDINCTTLEINGAVPHIDFHYNNSSSDYTARIVQYSSGQLTLEASLVQTSSNFLASGGITMYSQRSLKNVIDERGLSLSELSTIKPTRYTWKDNRDNRLHIGGIADDIQQVLPEVVYKTNDGVLTMDYGNAAFAVASSLIKPVVDHEKRIAMLEEENKQLRQEVERLKSA